MRDIEKRSAKAEKILEKSESKKVREAKKNAEKKQKQHEEQYQKAKKEDIKRRFNMQTPATQDRMKESIKTAEKNNKIRHDSFFKRLFKHKPKSL